MREKLVQFQQEKRDLQQTNSHLYFAGCYGTGFPNGKIFPIKRDLKLHKTLIETNVKDYLNWNEFTG